LVSIQLLANRQERIQLRGQGLKLYLETDQFHGDINRVDAIVCANSNLCAFKTWFAPKRANMTPIRHIQAFHHAALPLSCGFKSWDLAAFRCENDLL
jgi:hypothetical protein